MENEKANNNGSIPSRQPNPLDPPLTTPLGGGGGGDVCGSSGLSPGEINQENTHTTTDPGCLINRRGDFCYRSAPPHCDTAEHLDTLVHFLSVTWRFRGVRRFINRYGLAVVYWEVSSMLSEIADPSFEPIRSPAAALTWRIKASFDDNAGYGGKRLLEDL